jgi:hypothetical protein
VAAERWVLKAASRELPDRRCCRKKSKIINQLQCRGAAEKRPGLSSINYNVHMLQKKTINFNIFHMPLKKHVLFYILSNNTL